MDKGLEQREARRETRNGLGRFVRGLGVSLVGVGVLARQRRLLEDDLTRRHRTMAVGLGLVTLLAGAVTTLRFGWLDRKAAQDG